jgi:hypothetical protein
VDPKGSLVYTVDHVNMKVVGEPVPSEGPMDEAAEPTRAAVQAAIDEYVADRFVEGTAGSAVYASPQELNIAISGYEHDL